MVLQCSKLFYSKVSSGFLRQDSQSFYSFGKIQNVGIPELFVGIERHFHFKAHSLITFISQLRSSENFVGLLTIKKTEMSRLFLNCRSDYCCKLRKSRGPSIENCEASALIVCQLEL